MCNSSRVQFWNVWQATCFHNECIWSWGNSYEICKWIQVCVIDFVIRIDCKDLQMINPAGSSLGCVAHWRCEKHIIKTLVVLVGSWVLSGLTDFKTPLSGWRVAWGCSFRGIMPRIHVTVAPHSPVSTCNWDLCEDKAENSYLKLVFIFPWQHRHLQKAGLCHDFDILVPCLTAPLPPVNPSAKRITSYHHTLHFHYLISSLVVLVRLHWVRVWSWSWIEPLREFGLSQTLPHLYYQQEFVYSVLIRFNFL